MKKKTRKALSISYIDNLWSKAVKTRDKWMCRLCGQPAVDAHHIINRGQNWVLRRDLKNGISLCRGCHSSAETLSGRMKILNISDVDYLTDIEQRYKFKADYLTENEISEVEYFQMKADEFKEIINGNS